MKATETMPVALSLTHDAPVWGEEQPSRLVLASTAVLTDKLLTGLGSCHHSVEEGTLVAVSLCSSSQLRRNRRLATHETTALHSHGLMLLHAGRQSAADSCWPGSFSRQAERPGLPLQAVTVES
jgi:hypothetical protein